MTLELAAFVLALVGPFATAYFAYRQGCRSRKAVLGLRTNEMSHLDKRLDSIEQRLERVETWMFEHQRDHTA